ncbi:hypothetical protein R3W88_026936 [Solanum pinnatisectum]|uniref:Retrotransposon gag protein n=1 Tax=Solanum pinnatisectum TaxID=50273 RepID=A0AAV9LFT9_9SOLN|nr:hypothetical protein R3W88_026936 [Solanum pinnatisectum]
MAVPLTAHVASSIRKPPPGEGGRFELKQNMVQLIHSMGQFIDLPYEDPQIHIRNFLEISDTSIPTGVSSNYVRLTLFPHSVLGAARQWLNVEPPNSITTWDYLAKKFLRGGQQYQNSNQGTNPSALKGGMTNEELLQKLMVELGTKINARIDKQDENIRNIQMSQMSLEKQVAPVANSLNLHPQGGLPGDTEPNPKQLNAVSTRSGLQLEELALQKRDAEEVNKVKKVEEVVKNSNAETSVHINLPLVDILQGIPKYAKYVKEIVAKKRRLIYTKKTTVILQLTDRFVAKLEGVVEDVLLQVGSLIFPVDFVVLDFEPDFEVPFILGRPFIATGRALIDVAAGQLTMRAHDKVEVFDVYRALKLPSVYEELSVVTVVDHAIESQLIAPEDRLKRVLVGHDVDGDAEAQEIETYLNLAVLEIHKHRAEPLERELGPLPKPSIEEAPKLELKTLPAYLRYAYLGTNETLPVILSAELSEI